MKDSGDDARAQELDHNADQTDIKADLILVRPDKIEVVEQSAPEMAKPAAKLRLKNVKRASGIAAAIAERTAAQQSKSEKAGSCCHGPNVARRVFWKRLDVLISWC